MPEEAASFAANPAVDGRTKPPLPDLWVPGLLALGWLALYLPTYWDFLHGVWRSYSQGHEPLVLGIVLWLLWRKRGELARLAEARPASRVVAAGLLAFALLLYLFGRTQQFLRLELVSQVLVIAAMALAFKGRSGLRAVWFALFFLLFVVPLPYSTVMAITGPLKTGVSTVATWALGSLGLPIGRSGVVITIGQYQLLVAEACAGLQTMFTLEAMGLLYTNLMDYRSPVRSALMALLVVPVSFCANVVRVIVLVLVTYVFGDEAGQGFVHGFAGMVLFAVALLFIMLLDRAVAAVLPRRWAA